MRKTFGTGSVWEQTLGYSRAVQVDNTLYISATAASGEDGIVGDDFYTQTQYILQKLGKVLADAGFSFEDVVQSKLYLTDISKWEDAGRAHGEVDLGFDALDEASGLAACGCSPGGVGRSRFGCAMCVPWPYLSYCLISARASSSSVASIQVPP